MKDELRLIPVVAGHRYWVEWANGAIKATAIATTPDGRVLFRTEYGMQMREHRHVVAEILEAVPRPSWWRRAWRWLVACCFLLLLTSCSSLRYDVPGGADRPRQPVPPLQTLPGW